jgi:hypothetical protein
MIITQALAADALLLLHALFVCFVVLGLPIVIVGGLRGWQWVRDPRFRLAHLGAITVVTLQAWAGRICPLTRWENTLRRRAGGSGYPDTFIGHWLDTLLYHDLPDWMFTAAYTVFGLLVLATWCWVPPRCKRDSG